MPRQLFLSTASSEPLYDRNGNEIDIYERHLERTVQLIGRTVGEARQELANRPQRNQARPKPHKIKKRGPLK